MNGQPKPITVTVPKSTSRLEHFISAFARGCSAVFEGMVSIPEEPPLQSLAISQQIDVYVAWVMANFGDLRCTIAVDDLQNADAQPAVAQFIEQMVNLSKDRIKWILSSRTYGHLPHASWQAYALADSVITGDDLRMFGDEAVEFARAIGSPATASQVLAWADQTRGFPVPLTYAIRSSITHGVALDAMDSARAVTFSFLAAQLWKSLPADDRTLLELAAILPPTHIHDYERAGIAGASERIARLTGEIAFLTLGADSVFTMHDLFSDFIRQRLERAGSSVQLGRYHSASDLLLKNKRYDEAFELLSLSSDVERLLSVVEHFASEITDSSVRQRLIARIQNIAPCDLGPEALRLLNDYWAWLGEPQRSRRYADELLRRPNATSAQLLSGLYSMQRSANYQSRDQHDTLLNTSEAVMPKLNEPDRIQAMAFQSAFLARYPEGEAKARELIQSVQRNIDVLGNQARIDAQIAVATAAYYLGDNTTALRATSDAVSRATALQVPRELARTLNNYGLMLFHVFDSSVEDLFVPLREIVEKTGAWRFAHVSHWIPTRYFALQGLASESSEASALLRKFTPGDASQAERLDFLSRHTENLRRLLVGDYRAIVDDFRRHGEPREADSAYETLTTVAIAYSSLSQTSDAIRLLERAKGVRKSLSRLDYDSAREAVLAEVIGLVSVGSWSRAQQLHDSIAGTVPGLQALEGALTRFCCGPPFLDIQALIEPCIGKPYLGLPALLMSRVVAASDATATRVPLSATEMEVLRLLGQGKSNKEIAAARSRSIETVKRQVASLYQKLGVDNRTNAVAVARNLGLLQQPAGVAAQT
jgi:DNA-binding CsgD family transcriptional regulator